MLLIGKSNLELLLVKKQNIYEEGSSQDYIAGYCVVNDVSERDFQAKRAGQWTKGKSCDTFGPIGPYLVTKDEVPDPQDLSMTLDVNGQRMQDGSTKTMIFSVNHIVHYLSQFMSSKPRRCYSYWNSPWCRSWHETSNVFKIWRYHEIKYSRSG